MFPELGLSPNPSDDLLLQDGLLDAPRELYPVLVVGAPVPREIC
jgi:hypothetical protein